MQFRPLILMSALTMFGGPMIPARLAAQNTTSEIISFAAPGAGTAAGSGSGTFPESMNDTGVITGRYVDRNTVYHGFLRSPGERFVIFDAPGSSSALDDGTFPRSINSSGAITGNYSVADKEVNLGFLHSP